ncbi:hypothetical protein FisN_4Lh003 [Fistulifera solaris]|uniref:Uncharacterized protein n=1 Tax=Fistulifera solaris TaxID=1519565 RepID=A0A1Z5KDM5_FISSO|nr:hypothetical protein FisN_4Lh003 [Fistulifera solaris]|eukprot:GAX24296.1 hypothetical protein FisN_4Lh003 [Fistulifera solaris]
MKSVASKLSILIAIMAFVAPAMAFTRQSDVRTFARQATLAKMSFLPEPEREKLTRESEPEEFFKTNTDKMSDKDKIPIAIAGVAFITIPFIAGLIALYAAK